MSLTVEVAFMEKKSLIPERNMPPHMRTHRQFLKVLFFSEGCSCVAKKKIAVV